MLKVSYFPKAEDRMVLQGIEGYVYHQEVETGFRRPDIEVPGEIWHDFDERAARELVSRRNQNKLKMKANCQEFILIEEDSMTEHVISAPDEGSSNFVAKFHLKSDSTTSESSNTSRCHILQLPVELIESLCREYIDIATATCLGLTCHAFFNITEHLYPYQVNLHMRTKGRDRKCLGHLLTSWMAPKYSFNHSWGKFLLKRHWLMDENVVDMKWREKEGWKRIKLIPDKIGAVIAYESQTRGF